MGLSLTETTPFDRVVHRQVGLLANIECSVETGFALTMSSTDRRHIKFGAFAQRNRSLPWPAAPSARPGLPATLSSFLVQEIKMIWTTREMEKLKGTDKRTNGLRRRHGVVSYV